MRSRRAARAAERETRRPPRSAAVGGREHGPVLGDGALLLQLTHGPVQPGRVDLELAADLGDRDPRALRDEPQDVLATVATTTVAGLALRRPSGRCRATLPGRSGGLRGRSGRARGPRTAA